MTHLNGKWALTSSANFEPYLVAIGVADDQRAKAHESLEKTGAGGLVEEYIITAGATVQRKIYLGSQLVREGPTIPFGKEVTGPSLDGRTCQLTITENGPDKFTRSEVFGGTIKSTTVYEVHGDELVATLSSGSATSVRKYKKV
jgi:hypothetical protein